MKCRNCNAATKNVKNIEQTNGLADMITITKNTPQTTFLDLHEWHKTQPHKKSPQRCWCPHSYTSLSFFVCSQSILFFFDSTTSLSFLVTSLVAVFVHCIQCQHLSHFHHRVRSKLFHVLVLCVHFLSFRCFFLVPFMLILDGGHWDNFSCSLLFFQT